jgi:hypothetical protein
MVVADISSFAYFAPIAAFLMVFIVVYAVFTKTKVLGESKYLNLFIAFIIATMFISVAGAREYVQTITPWIAILLVSLAFLLATLGFVGKPVESMTKGIGIGFVVIMVIVFLVSALFVFSNVFGSIVPGPGYGDGLEPKTVFFLNWLYSPTIMGAIILILISAGVSWVLVKKDK